MKTIDFLQMNKDLDTTFDIVVEDSTPVVVTRDEKEPVVLISLKDYHALEETIYLMQSQENANRLNHSIAELEVGGGKERKLILK